MPEWYFSDNGGLDFIKGNNLGYLAGSGRAFNSWSQGWKFEPHIECSDYLKLKSLKNRK